MLRVSARFARQLACLVGRSLAGVLPLGVVLAFALGLSPQEAAGAGGVDLRPETIAAFDDYVRLTDARTNEELRRGTNLLWIDALPESDRGQAYEELRRGEVKVQR